MSKIIVQVRELSKKYQLGTISHGSFAREISSIWARIRHKEDPNSIVINNNLQHSGSAQNIWALKNINLDIIEGETIGIIGKNGAGKSTLLKILSRITSPTDGCIKIKGRIASLLEVGTGFHPELTGRENIYLNGSILGMKKDEIDNRLDEIIKFSGVDKYIDTPVKRYSNGMKVRLAFSVAAHLKCDILLVDEVLAVGDSEFRRKSQEKINNDSNKFSKTTIIVSHQLRLIEKLCNRLILMDQGKIIEDSNDVNSIINKYRSKYMPQIDYQWLNSGREFNSNYFMPEELCVLTESNEPVTRPISDIENVYIRLIGNVKTIDPSFRLGIAIMDEQQNTIIESFFGDSKIKYDNESLLIGKNELRARLPVEILKAGRYSIKVICWLSRIEWIHNTYDESPSIILEVNKTWESHSGLEQRGMIAPKIEWINKVKL